MTSCIPMHAALLPCPWQNSKVRKSISDFHLCITVKADSNIDVTTALALGKASVAAAEADTADYNWARSKVGTGRRDGWLGRAAAPSVTRRSGQPGGWTACSKLRWRLGCATLCKAAASPPPLPCRRHPPRAAVRGAAAQRADCHERERVAGAGGARGLHGGVLRCQAAARMRPQAAPAAPHCAALPATLPPTAGDANTPPPLPMQVLFDDEGNLIPAAVDAFLDGGWAVLSGGWGCHKNATVAASRLAPPRPPPLPSLFFAALMGMLSQPAACCPSRPYPPAPPLAPSPQTRPTCRPAPPTTTTTLSGRLTPSTSSTSPRPASPPRPTCWTLWCRAPRPPMR